ncbi:unnamed protein product [Mytilus coruscus]|uniref:Acyl-ACP thioesterase-like C-terminal domain-containing protein n=1 Tax=Mytilus coruscus TaxID=42192 RepID=A0A6J8ADA5_MYTCO|nr:unnamed protein product [Mytilus coruscus]
MPVVTVLKDDAETTKVMVEGQMYNFDDRTGFWSPWSLSDFVVGVSNADNISPVMDYLRADEENTPVFQKRQIMRFNPNIFTYSKLKFKFHIIHQIEPGEEGGKSYVWNSVVKDVESQTVLLERAVKLVTIDRTSRKAVELPKWFRQKYQNPNHKLKKLNDLPNSFKSILIPPEFPSDCYQWSTIVRYSDLDFNMHMHQSVYTKICMDAVTSAALKGKLQYFKRDICFYPLESVDITFIGESFAENELLVKILQDKCDHTILRCLVENGRKPVTYLVLKLGLTSLSTSKL